MSPNRILYATLSSLYLVASPASAARIKDIASLKGVRNNALTGYGVVIGLSGTGDRGLGLTSNSLTQVLKGLGIEQKDAQFDTKNAAAVLVTGQLPAFARIGSAIDVTVSSIGSASSLDGGNLLMTSLRGSDGKVYAVAQGKIVMQKKEGSGSSRGQTGSLVTASVPSGAMVEREIVYNWSDLKALRYQLHAADFTTAARVARRINEELAGKYATSSDAATIDVIVPYGFEGTTVDLIAQLESIDIEADRQAKVVVNPRTGTVVLGQNVQVLPVAIAHSGLRLEIQANGRGPASGGGGGSGRGKQGKRMIMMNRGATIADLVQSLNNMGASAEELTSLLQSLRAAGALQAELEIL